MSKRIVSIAGRADTINRKPRKPMPRKLIYSAMLLALGVANHVAAASFVNGGFEDGNFNGWTQGSGRWSGGWPIDPALYQPGAARYNATYQVSAVVPIGNDPLLSGAGVNLNQVYSGNYSARINNSNNNYSVNTIQQTVLNYTDPKIYFAWSAVLQGSHVANDSDNFTLTLRDTTTNTDVYSASYSSFSAPATFKVVNVTGKGKVYYSGWQVQPIDVSNRKGHDFTLSLLAADCPYGGHWGYVYLDGFGAVIPVGSGGFVPYSSSRSSGAATVMDTLNGAPGTNAAMQQALTTGAALPPGQRSAMLERVIPMNGRGMPLAAYTNFDATLDAVGLRVSGLEPGNVVATAAPRRPIILAALGNPSGLIDEMSDRPDNSKTFWVRALGHDGRQGQYNGFAGFHTQAGGLALGSDVDLGERWVLGGAFSASRGTVDFGDQRTGDNSSVDSVQLTGYTTKNLGNWYVHGTLAYAQHSFATNRNTTLTGVAHGGFRGDQWGARMGAAWPNELTKATVTPAIGLDYSQLKVPGYTEFGAGATSLIVNAQTIERLRSRIGGRVSTKLDSNGDYVFRPVLHLYWVHDFKSQTPQLSANFVGGGPAFLTPSQPLPQDTASLGASLVISRGNDFTSEIRYGLDLARSYSGQSLSAMARWLF